MSTYPNSACVRARLRRNWLGGGLLAVLLLLLPAAAAAAPAAPAVGPAAEPAANPRVEPAAPAATTWYVDGSSGADGNCNAAASPCRTIQAAIERAASGDTILVAGSANGTVYIYGAASPCTRGLAANAVVCVANKKLTLRGGYATGNFSTYAPAQNLTVIDGQGRTYGIAVMGFGNAGGTALDIAGFTVRNGYGTGISARPGADSYFGFGGGMRAEEVSQLTMQEMVFDANRAVGGNRTSGEGGVGAGGAVSLRGATATLSDIRFVNNQALGGTGATRGGYAQGGALFVYETNLTGSRLVFENNVARAGSSGGSGSSNGRADGQGGAAALMQRSQVTLNEVTVRGNQTIGGDAATFAGGAFGGGLFGEEADITINGADIRANVARAGVGDNSWLGSGGGIMVIHSTLNVNRARVLGNAAEGGNSRSGKWGVPNGGGITVSWDTPGKNSRFTLTNSFVAGNVARRGQGGEIEYGGGGGLWIQATEATVEHNTIADNQLGAGPGLYGQGVLLINTGDSGANVTFRHNLITGHNGDFGSAVEVFSRNAATFGGGLFFNNRWNTSQGNPNQGNNIGTINGLNTMGVEDPLYVAPGAPDLNYSIQADSPARDKAAGSQQTVDIDGQARSDGKPDFGAHEFAGEDGGGIKPGLPPGDFRLFLPRIVD